MGRNSLKVSLLGGIFLTMVTLMCVGSITIYLLVKRRSYAQLDETIADKVLFYREICWEKDGNIKFHMPDKVWLDLQDGDNADFFQFRRSDGKSLFQSTRLGDADLPAVGIDADNELVRDNVNLPDGSAGRCAGRTFRIKDKESGKFTKTRVHVVVAQDLEHIQESLAELRNTLFTSGGVFTAAILLVAWWLSSRSLKPVARLTDDLAAIPLGSRKRFSDTGVPDELLPIVSRLNELMQRVDLAIERERQFTSNAAHELRTPLAVLRSELELTVGKNRSIAYYQESIQRALAAENDLEGVVDNLLWLARLEAGFEKFSDSTFILGKLMRKAWMPHFEAAEAKNIEVEWNIPDQDLEVTSNVDLISVILRNLYDNAVSYSPHTCTLEIAAFSTSDTTVFSVANPSTSSNLTTERMRTLFERNERGEESSSNSESGPHLGIGLSLTRRIVQVIGARIDADVDDKSGTVKFSVILPK